MQAASRQAASKQIVEKLNVFWLSLTTQGGQERPKQPNRASQGTQEGQIEPARTPGASRSSQSRPDRASKDARCSQIEAQAPQGCPKIAQDHPKSAKSRQPTRPGSHRATKSKHNKATRPLRSKFDARGRPGQPDRASRTLRGHKLRTARMQEPQGR
jgi:hypothetical protein